MADKEIVEELATTKAQVESLTTEKAALEERLAGIEAKVEAERLAARKAELKAEAEGYENLSVKTEEYVDRFVALEATNKDLAEWVRGQFSAHDKIAKGLMEELGTDIEGIEDPADRFEAVVKGLQNKEKMSYEDALVASTQKYPELSAAYAYRAVASE